MATILAVVFDFGGVISRGGEEAARDLDRRYSLPEGSIWKAFYRNQEWRELQLGRGSFDAWRQEVMTSLESIAGRPLPNAWEEWIDGQRGVREEMVGLVRGLRDGYKVGLLSNATVNLEDMLERRYGIITLFDVIVNSARVGMAKPDPRIFTLAAERLAVAPTECVFIDDLEPNVRAAADVGMQALHFTTHPQLLDDLRGLGVAC
jgi:putative hydrolase of the HAD superfamily